LSSSYSSNTAPEERALFARASAVVALPLSSTPLESINKFVTLVKKASPSTGSLSQAAQKKAMVSCVLSYPKLLEASRDTPFLSIASEVKDTCMYVFFPDGGDMDDAQIVETIGAWMKQDRQVPDTSRPSQREYFVFMRAHFIRIGAKSAF